MDKDNQAEVVVVGTGGEGRVPDDNLRNLTGSLSGVLAVAVLLLLTIDLSKVGLMGIGILALQLPGIPFGAATSCDAAAAAAGPGGGGGRPVPA